MDDCITSKGPNTTITRHVGDYDKLSISDRIQVQLVQDAARRGEVTVYGPSNLLGQITSDVDGGELILKNENTCNFVRSFDYELKITLYISDLKEVRMESISTLSNEDTLVLKNLRLLHSALSDVQLTIDVENETFVQSLNSAHTTLFGSSRVLKGSIEEVSELNAGNFVCEEVLLDIHTPLDCTVDGTKGLFIKIYNSGNVIYANEPSDYKILEVVRGTGKLILK